MNIIKFVSAAAVALLVMSAPATGQAEERVLAGCYKPVSGFATSVCTDGDSCETQTGVYKIVLKNPRATYGRRVVVMSGKLEGLITLMGNHCAGVTAQHVLTDRDGTSTISTGGDVACPVGGDFVNKIEIVETLTVMEGTGEYVNLIPGGTVTMSGKLGLKTGINKFKVAPLPEDEVCFYGLD
ncbi:MAG: hypothetical protein V2I26_09080 [Halieaceae bacterium]|jgi:hypothetical protein|nr:hypothetical protein [Halieaceae bacterium]